MSEYSTLQLKVALASLSTSISSTTTSNTLDIVRDCAHIYGFNTNYNPNNNNSSSSSSDDSDDSFFMKDHELSMLQTITARRILDYQSFEVRDIIRTVS